MTVSINSLQPSMHLSVRGGNSVPAKVADELADWPPITTPLPPPQPRSNIVRGWRGSLHPAQATAATKTDRASQFVRALIRRRVEATQKTLLYQCHRAG